MTLRHTFELEPLCQADSGLGVPHAIKWLVVGQFLRLCLAACCVLVLLTLHGNAAYGTRQCYLCCAQMVFAPRANAACSVANAFPRAPMLLPARQCVLCRALMFFLSVL